MMSNGVRVFPAWNTGLRSSRFIQSSQGHARECTLYISTGMSPVPNFDTWLEMPTKATAAAYSSVSALALHIDA